MDRGQGNSYMTPEDIAGYAARLVSDDRNHEYGHPLDNLDRAARIWSVILDCDVTAEQVALCMVGMKIARQVHKPKPDTVVDIIGYALTLHMVEVERAVRGVDHL
jgi:hypothetical protein